MHAQALAMMLWSSRNLKDRSHRTSRQSSVVKGLCRYQRCADRQSVVPADATFPQPDAVPQNKRRSFLWRRPRRLHV
jgi:hypothetical protein